MSADMPVPVSATTNSTYSECRHAHAGDAHDQPVFQFSAVGECLPQVRSQRLLDADAGTQRFSVMPRTTSLRSMMAGLRGCSLAKASKRWVSSPPRFADQRASSLRFLLLGDLPRIDGHLGYGPVFWRRSGSARRRRRAGRVVGEIARGRWRQSPPAPGRTGRTPASARCRGRAREQGQPGNQKSCRADDQINQGTPCRQSIETGPRDRSTTLLLSPRVNAGSLRPHEPRRAHCRRPRAAGRRRRCQRHPQQRPADHGA